MATEKEEILLEIVVSNETATKAIFESQKSIERLKKSQAELNKAREEGNVTDAEYSKRTTAIKVAIDQQKEAIRQNEKELRNNIKSQRENNDSLAALRAQLSNSVKEYDNLSKAEREASKGKDLQKSINELTEELKLAEEATGRFQRNVGNYPKQLKELQAALIGLEPGTEEFIRLSKEAGELKDKINDSKEATKAFAAGAKTTQAKNIFTQVSADIEDLDFEGASEKAKTFASVVKSISFNEVVNGIKSFATALFDVGKSLLLNPFTAIAAAIAGLAYITYDLVSSFRAAATSSKSLNESLAESQKRIEELSNLQIEYLIRIGQAQGKISKEQAELAKDEIKNNQERKERTKRFSDDLIKIAKDRNISLADLQGKYFDESDVAVTITGKKELDNRKSFNTARRRLEQEYLKDILVINKTNALERQAIIAENDKEEIEKQKQKNEELKKLEEERLKNQRDIDRQLQDLLIARIQDELDKQIEAEKVKTQRANEDLLYKLNNEKNLTEKARKEINDIIFLNEQALQTKIIELTKLADEQDIKRELDKQTKLIDAKIQLTLKGTEEEKNLLIQKLEIQKKAELNNANLTTVEKLAIEQKFLEESDKINADYLVKKYTRLQSQFEAEYKLKLLSYNNDESLIDQKYIIEAEKAIAERDRLLLMDEETKTALYNNQLNYEIAVAESNQRVKQTQDEVLNKQLESGVAFSKSFAQITGTVGNLIFELANDSAAAAEFSKTLAVVNIGIALAEGIANVIKASKASDPVSLIVSIAAGTAAVASSILAAKKALSETPPTPEPPRRKFATGGLITGEGTGTSDSIEARVSNGESIINANSTSLFSPLLSSLNQIGGGVAFGQANIANQLQGEEMLARAFAKGVAMLPNPVVSVKEINNVNERLTILKEL